ncbi:MAG: tetratricopeptide repeat protein [Gammaproteobacteria bacterium]|nr:tetratricopeptide repeat protein [Gammaproteobacteria bacterium]MDH5800829.1 tetratricopeptide repeat protein [Gammaproteobacteria bacterium]
MAAKSNHSHLMSITVVVLACVAIGFSVQMAQRYATESTNVYAMGNTIQGYQRPGSHLAVRLSPEDAKTVQDSFERAAALIHAGQYEYAIKALDQVIRLHPKLPSAYVNMGYAYLNLEDYRSAASAFAKAIDLRPEQANAYYGMAEVLEKTNELETALGFMRTFIHLSDPGDPFMAKARSALWEWEAELGRIPGVEPGTPDNKSQLIIKNSPHKPPVSGQAPHSAKTKP